MKRIPLIKETNFKLFINYMKKKDYLLFHAQTVFKICQENKLVLFYIPHLNKVSYEDHFPTSGIVKVNNDMELYNYFQNGIYLYYPYSISEKYLNILFLNGSDEQINYFLKHNKKIYGDIHLFTINTLLPSLSELLIEKIFTEGSTTFPFINPTEFSSTILILKNHPKITFDIEEVLATYLFKNYKNLSTESSKTLIRNILIEYFPHSLIKFEKIPFIHDYLKFNQDSSSLIIEGNSLFHCTSLSLNISLIENKYILSNFVRSSHIELLSLFFDTLIKKGNHINLVKIYMENNLHVNTLYIILKKEEPTISLFLNNIISDYYSYVLTTKTSNPDWNWNVLTEETEYWVTSKLSYDKLEKELPVKESLFIKTNKI